MSCPSGKKLTGGGGRCSATGPQGFVFLVNSYPINDSEWLVSCDTPNDQTVQAQIYIFCE